MDRRKFLTRAAAGAAIGGAAKAATARKYPFPIIDCHVHLYDPTRPQGVPWPDPVTQPTIYRRFLPGDYRKIAEPFGVVGMIETECSPWVEDNYWVMDVSAKETIVVGEVGDLVPGRSDFGEHLGRLHKNPLYRGIRFTNLWGRNVTESLKDPQAMADLKALSDAGLSLDMSSGPGGLPDLFKVSDAIPDLRIVIDHLPGSRVPEEAGARDAYLKGLREAAKRKVYVKFSEIFQRVDAQGHRVTTGGRIPRELSFYRPWLEEIWEIFGADRLLYASDWSNSEPNSTFGETIAMVHEFISQKDPAAVEKVFWKNSLAAYRWVKRAANQPSLA